MMLLKNAKDIHSLKDAISKCKGDVMLISDDGREQFNLKSTLSRYLGIAELCKDNGDGWRIFCMNKDDEGYLLKFFFDLHGGEKDA